MQRRSLLQPNVAVDAGPFVEPPFFQRGIRPHAHHVPAAVIQVIAYLVFLPQVSARLAAAIESVYPHPRIAENAVETQDDTTAVVFLRHEEFLPVPTHAGFGVLPSNCLVTVAVARLRGERQVHDPIVGQCNFLPQRVFEVHGIRTGVVNRSRLGEIIEILGAAAEVLCRIGGVAQSELPTVVEPLHGPLPGVRRGAVCSREDCHENAQGQYPFHMLQHFDRRHASPLSQTSPN